MPTELHWVEAPWVGKLALAARPRGGDWLESELASWSYAGVNTVFSLLTREEERDLLIADEAEVAKENGMRFLSFPIVDRRVPKSDAGFTKALDELERELTAGRNVVLHCRQGVGRAGLVAACLLLTKGVSPDEAVGRISEARGVSVPETPEQRAWLDRYASRLEVAR